MELNYNLNEKQQNVINALEELGYKDINVEWENTSGIGLNCILHCKFTRTSSKEQIIDITDYDTW